MPPILSTSYCKFNGARSCTHAQKTIPMAPIHPFTKQMVPSLCPELLTQSLSKSFSPVPYKVLPSINNIFTRVLFFLCFFVSFLSHTFRGFAGACVNPRSIFPNSLFVHSLPCQIITLSFINALPLPIILISA